MGALAWLLLAAAAACLSAYALRAIDQRLDIIAAFAIQAMLAAGVSSAIFVASRRWLGAVAALLFAGALASATGAFAPGRRACAPGEAQLRVFFANLHVANADFERVAAAIEASDADVALLVEVGPEMESELKARLGGYDAIAGCDGRPRCESLVFARGPTAQVRTIAGGDGRRAAASVERQGLRIEVVSVHLHNPLAPPRGVQYRQAEDMAGAVGERTVIIGDFNATPWGATFDRLAEAGGPALAARPLGYWGTWPSAFPTALRLPIDNVILPAGATCGDQSIGPDIGSDHLPIIVDLALNP